MYKVIGNGMLARAFMAIPENQLDAIIFASGVSDSGCIDNANFMREKNLLIDELEKSSKDIRFIYFSTCSVYDDQLINSPYVIHKKNMEAIVFKYTNGIVFRLAQIAGPNSPPKTLLQSIRTALVNKQKFEVWMNAKRNILDVIDARDIIVSLLGIPNSKFKCLNIANRKSHSMIEIVNTFEKVFSTEINKIFLNKGNEYHIDVSFMEKEIEFNKVCEKNYLEEIIRKYYL